MNDYQIVSFLSSEYFNLAHYEKSNKFILAVSCLGGTVIQIMDEDLGKLLERAKSLIEHNYDLVKPEETRQ